MNVLFVGRHDPGSFAVLTPPLVDAVALPRGDRKRSPKLTKTQDSLHFSSIPGGAKRR